MAQDYKAILSFLYDEFGDDLLEMGKTALESKLQESKTQENNPAAGKKTKGKKGAKTSASSKDRVEPNKEDAVKGTEKFGNNTHGDEVKPTNYHDADVFEQQTLTKMQHNSVVVLNSGDVAGAVKDLILMAGEVRKFEEAQITVRTDISARRDIAIANIEVQKAALMTYLDKSFDERKENFQKLFTVVDDALEKDSMQQLAMGLESIIKLADSSPFKDLQTIEATASALTDPNHKWDF